MSTGWVKFHRELIKWEWFTDVNTCHLFTYLLLSATHKETKWRGIVLRPGQLITGRIILAQHTGLSERQVRTSLEKLKATNEVTSQSTNNYTVITITNWNKYQDTDQPDVQRASNGCPADDQPATTYKNVKKEKNVNNVKNISLGDFENFWNEYGKIGNKQQALKSYNKSIKEGVQHEVIIAGLGRYQASCRAANTEQRFIKHASTWLNNRGWDDEYPIYQQSSPNKSKHERAKEALGLA